MQRVSYKILLYTRTFVLFLFRLGFVTSSSQVEFDQESFSPIIINVFFNRKPNLINFPIFVQLTYMIGFKICCTVFQNASYREETKWEDIDK